MVDVTGEAPLEPDVVTCVCGQQWDRNVYSQCRGCLTDLWQLNRAVAPEPPPPGSGTGAATVLEGDAAAAAGIDILVCGRRLTVRPGDTMRLGRQDDFETAGVFRDAKNVSRQHATLRFDNGRLYVTDTGSSNGTYVNGQQLPANTEYEIRAGQTLRLASNVPVEIHWEK